MKAKEVMEKLNITRPTLCSYVKKGYIHATELPNGQYDYDEASVNNFSKSIATVPVPSSTDMADIDDLKLDLIKDMFTVTRSLMETLANMRVVPVEFANELNKLLIAYKQLDNK